MENRVYLHWDRIETHGPSLGNLGGLRHIFIIAFNSMILYDALTSEEAFSVRFNLKYIEGISFAS